ncbi:MAG: M23 family metallopeptidase [Bacteroidales bacterium]|jgi:murein DD-endopeptidase MepM/ murein hydrolase activator NlpD|nr:M23 family metallopeptidase [Bacteroidales bacterium]MBQ3659687.1 M23 family metallopeptidase [Bacteroidales bacterium]MBQ5401764.1 M23 family metallopeptidase [Bacteroidales bacterium]MBQ6082211.1 M23 family metallopeptidase [Bacteroidales bacterium]MBQ7457599.1 M23 family metallopeptidase [Bacteroidales bacterium]
MPKNRKTYILIALVAVATYLLIDFTPLRRTIRGYPTRATREAALENRLKIDSLERLVQLWAFQVGNIQRVMSGREAMDLDSIAALQSATGETDMYATMYAKQDSILRGIVEKETALDLSQADSHGTLLEGLDFFTPLKGMVTEPYNLAINHPYIDIAADENATVYSILDGTVVSAGYNEDTGYVMIIQHGNDLVSIYKHNDRLLKQAGDKVKTGTPIAIVGNTGRLATGVQLHLELWHAGEAIDPAKYISF